DGPILRDGKPYSQLAHLAEDVSAFVGIGSILKKSGLSVPKLYAENLNDGLLLLEDLGNQTIIDNDRKPIESRYKKCIEMLGHFHGGPFEKNVPLNNDKIYSFCFCSCFNYFLQN
ncbi:MAG: hypothetical protein COB12_11280, partial [Flavobacterium sp.]